MILSREAAGRFPEIIETKKNLWGASKTFACRRLAGDDRSVVVLHVLEQPLSVAGVHLPAGTLTFGHFWRDKPYNVYHWLSPRGQTLGLYFNIAEGTSIAPDAIEWRDLVLDVLALPDAPPQVLDRDELPPGLPEEESARIEHGVATLLQDLPSLRAELELHADRIWQDVFGGPRRTGGSL